MCYSYPATKKLTLHCLHIRRVQGSIISCANNLRCYWECVGEQLGNLVGKPMGTRWEQGNKILSFALIIFFLFFGLLFHDAGIEVCELCSANSLQCVEKWYQSHGEVNPFFLGTKELSVSLCVLSLSSNLCSRVSLLRFDGFTRTFQDKLFKGYNMGICNSVIYATLGSYGLSFNRFIYTCVCSCAPVLFSILARPSILRFFTRLQDRSISKYCISFFFPSFPCYSRFLTRLCNRPSYVRAWNVSLAFHPATILFVSLMSCIVLSCIWFVHPFWVCCN